MMLKLKSGIVVAVALVLAVALASDASAGSSTQTFDEIKAASASQDRPILMKIGASWCKSCKAFDQATVENAELKAALEENVVLFTVDGEVGEGVDIARRYGVVAFPTFILANASGETMDRWMGFKKYDGASEFVETMESALADPTTIAQKLDRFRENPSEDDARKLGDLRQYQGYSAEAVAYYKRAQELNPESETDYDLRIFGAMARGQWEKLYSVEQVKGQADLVFASTPEPEAMFEVLYTMRKIGSKTHQPALFHPYLQATVERTENVHDEHLAQKRAWLLPDYAMQIEKNPEKAVQLRRDLLPEDWEQDATQLNNFAWWCFENEVNLDEAEMLARRGVELAESGTPKANVLDTLAEICNLKNDCSHAVEYIRLAIAEDPENEYFQKQLVRFEEILALSE